jgi:cyclic pyranopterin monophosphate synthase
MMTQNITDFFKESQYHMANITKKMPTFRRAIAMGRIQVGEAGFDPIQKGALPKGDVLKLAEIAGVQGAKNAWQQIPLCHPLPLEHVALYLELEKKTYSVLAYAVVSATAKTGVEMEAIAAINAALLTVYDLTKPVEPALNISDVRLLLKEGGKKGLWVHPDGLPPTLKGFLPKTSDPLLEKRTVAVITLSDRAYRKEYEDKSGLILQKNLKELGYTIKEYRVLPDEASLLEDKLTELSGNVDLIITTGGTGISPRDITPETLSKLAHIEIPGIGELLRSAGSNYISTAWLSRSIAVVMNKTLVVALPGNPNAVKESLEAIKKILPHALEHVQNKKELHKMGDVA